MHGRSDGLLSGGSCAWLPVKKFFYLYALLLTSFESKSSINYQLKKEVSWVNFNTHKRTSSHLQTFNAATILQISHNVRQYMYIFFEQESSRYSAWIHLSLIVTLRFAAIIDKRF